MRSNRRCFSWLMCPSAIVINEQGFCSLLTINRTRDCLKYCCDD